MYRYELFNVDEINQLKNELELHRRTLHAITNEGLLQNYIKAKDDNYDLKVQLFQLKGEIKAMENEYYEKELDTEMELTSLNSQIEETNDSVDQMKQELAKITYTMEQLMEAMQSEVVEKVNTMLNSQHINALELKQEFETMKQAFLKLKEESQARSKNNVANRSEFRRMQNMLQSSNIQQPAASNRIRQPSSPSFTRREAHHQGGYSSQANTETISFSKGNKQFRQSIHDQTRNVGKNTITPKKKHGNTKKPRHHTQDKFLDPTHQNLNLEPRQIHVPANNQNLNAEPQQTHVTTNNQNLNAE
ncbi:MULTISPECIES: hypothetical protein, partial [Clostridia]|uniref:hypothetical protein n=1 Tax=Clostridia TaxID=186801 RepID=UPI000EBD4EA5